MKRNGILLAAVAAVLIAATVATWHDGRSPDVPPSQPTGEDADHAHLGPQPHDASPATVVEQGLTLMFSWVPVIDPAPGAALTRARAWLTGNLAAAANSIPAQQVRAPAPWASWQRSGDVVTATVRADRSVPCGTDDCVVTAHLTQTVLHRDGTDTPYSASTITAALTRTPQGWRLASYRLTT
ncbi:MULTISPECIES: hypothetical protein [Nocardia]|uniref:hypothetical protein n=1 Tax=Nocardia TaxID=1817 RepID=UPI000D69BFD5|nr:MULTISPECIES: hypothetical protein [Nocardia]